MDGIYSRVYCHFELFHVVRQIEMFHRWRRQQICLKVPLHALLHDTSVYTQWEINRCVSIIASNNAEKETNSLLQNGISRLIKLNSTIDYFPDY
jgi:hypothetical protein